MIIGEFIACSTCKKNYRARIQVGLKNVQELNFFCHQCNEPIRLTLDLSKGVILGENCEPGPELNATPHYLSDDIIASGHEVNAENSFPSMRFMKGVIDKIGMERIRKAGVVPDRFDLDAARAPDKKWQEFKKIWRLKRSGQDEIWKPLLQKFAAKYKCDLDFDSALFSFLGSMRKIDERLVSELETTKKSHREDFDLLLDYYHQNHKDSHTRSYYNLIGEYFDLFHEFSKTYLYAKFQTAIPDDATIAAGNFSTVKKFYASAYEFYSSAIFILTCLNNIQLGRQFDKLGQIDLKKYLNMDKAKRRDNFIDNLNLTAVTSEFDNGIRNASFHNWMRLSEDNLRVEYNAGGNGDLVSMSYAEYLYKCSTLFLQCCELFQLELIMTEIYRNSRITNQIA